MGPLEVPTLRIVTLLVVDSLIAVTSLWLSMLLRFEGSNPSESGTYWDSFPIFLLVLVGSRLTVNGLLKLHRWSFRLSGLHDGARVVSAATIGTGVFVLVL